MGRRPTLTEQGLGYVWQKTRARVLASRPPVCHWCGKRVGKGAHVDHVVPRSKGGARYDLRNLVVSCPSCNWRRGNELGRPSSSPPAARRRVWAGAISLDDGR